MYVVPKLSDLSVAKKRFTYQPAGWPI